MPFFSELKNDAKVHHGFLAFNSGMEKPLLKMQQQVMRSEDSPLTIAQRELIAAYVSALNECAYCRGTHTATAIEFGVEEGVVEALLKNIESAPVDDKLKPIFKFVRKLTNDLHHMDQADADEVFEAGWSSRALYDAISVCCVFNFMNRYANGLGLNANPAEFGREGKMLKTYGYDAGDMLKLK